MPDITGKEVEELLRKAWDEFFAYYDGEVRKYSKTLASKDGEKAKKEHWILWNEADLMVQLALYFKEQLAKNPPSVEVEMHFDKTLSASKPSNFDDFDFEDQLEPLKNDLRRKQGPRVDLIIAKKNYPGPFLLCAEAKMSHYSASRYYRTPQEEIEKDIRTLVAIEKRKIAERVVFMVFDDYYCLLEPKKYKEIESSLEKTRKDFGITVLEHNSMAKIE